MEMLLFKTFNTLI